MAAYYNEIEPFCVEWLGNLIKERLIPDGEIDCRSIVDVRAVDLTGFSQCHFFAGLGGWSYALRLAGWPDDRPVWTGSCPCQPFSLAGSHKGKQDHRHLWPEWFRLIEECRPAAILGEQVASALRHGWWDHVVDDLEGQDYACAAIGLPAVAVGAPHIRQRLWFCAHANADSGRRQVERLTDDAGLAGAPGDQPDRLRAPGRGDGADVADAGSGRFQLARAQPAHHDAGPRDEAGGPLPDPGGGELRDVEQRLSGRQPDGVPDEGQAEPGDDGPPWLVADAAGKRGEPGLRQAGALDDRHQPADSGADLADAGREGPPSSERGAAYSQAGQGRGEGRAAPERGRRRPQPVVGCHAHGFPTWVDPMRPWQGNWEEGLARTVPIHPGRVGRLKALGNAIVPQVAAEVIRAFMEIIDDQR